MTLDEIRQLYPSSAGLSDGEVVQRMAEFTGVSKPEMADYLGYKNTAGIGTDTAVDLGRGVNQLGQAVVGAGNLASGGAFGPMLKDKVGIDLNAVDKKLSGYYSDKRQESDAAVDNAHGFVDKAAAVFTHPRSLVGGVVQSIPSMAIPMGVAGKVGSLALKEATEMAAARGLVGEKATEFIAGQVAKAPINAATAASWGGLSGAQTAAEYAEQHPGDTKGMYTAAIGTGLSTAALTGGMSLLPGGGAIQRFGSKVAGNETEGGFTKRVGLGVANQSTMMGGMSAAQQASINYADGDPLGKGVAEAAASGGVVGAAFGAAHGAFHGAPKKSMIDGANEHPATAEGDAIAQQPAAPAQAPAALTSTSLAEYINRNTGVDRPAPASNEASMTAALSEPTVLHGQDPATGHERPIDNGQLTMANAAPQIVDPAARPTVQTKDGKVPPLPATAAERQMLYQKFGEPQVNKIARPDGTTVDDGHHFAGDHYPALDAEHGQNGLATVVNKLAQEGRGKGAGEHIGEVALADSMRENGSQVTVATLKNAGGILSSSEIKYALVGASEPAKVADRLQRVIGLTDKELYKANAALDKLNAKIAEDDPSKGGSGQTGPYDLAKPQDKIAKIAAKQKLYNDWLSNLQKRTGEDYGKITNNGADKNAQSVRTIGPDVQQRDSEGGSSPAKGPDARNGSTGNAEAASQPAPKGPEQVRLAAVPEEKQVLTPGDQAHRAISMVNATKGGSDRVLTPQELAHVAEYHPWAAVRAAAAAPPVAVAPVAPPVAPKVHLVPPTAPVVTPAKRTRKPKLDADTIANQKYATDLMAGHRHGTVPSAAELEHIATFHPDPTARSMAAEAHKTMPPEVAKKKELVPLANASVADKVRIRLALGTDKEGHQVNAPMSHQEIATKEGVTKAAVTKSLHKYGITEEAINKATAAHVDAAHESELPLTHGDGFQIADSPNQTDVMENHSKREIEIADAATRLINANKDAKAPEVISPKEQAVHDAIDTKRQAEAEAGREAFQQEQFKSPYVKDSMTAWDQLRSQGAPEYRKLTRAEQAEWINTYAENARNGDPEHLLAEHQLAMEKDLDGVRYDEDTGKLVSADSRAAASGQREAEAGGPALLESSGEVRGVLREGEGIQNTKPVAVSVKPKRAVVRDDRAAAATDSEVKGKISLKPRASLNSMSDRGAPPSVDNPLYDAAAAVREQLYAVHAKLSGDGIGHAMEAVHDWHVADMERGLDGFVELEGGKYNVTLNKTLADRSPTELQDTITHELGHAVDDALHGGIYSEQPEMSVWTNKAGAVQGGGAVSRELLGNYTGKGGLAELLDYPLGPKYEDKGRAVMQQELFAQLWTAWHSPALRAIVERELPVSAKYMREVMSDVKSTDAFQSSETSPAESRRNRFTDRDASGGVRPQFGSDSGSHREASRLFSRSSTADDGVHAARDDKRPGAIVAAQRSNAAKIIDAMPPKLQPVVRGVFATVHDTISHAGMMGAYMHDLADWGVTHGLPAIKAIPDWMAAKGAYKIALDQKSGDLAKRFQDLPEKSQDDVQKFLHESTFSQKWGYQPEWRGKVEIDPTAKAQWDKLGPDGQKMADDMFKHGDDTWTAQNKAIQDIAQSHFTEMVDYAEQHPGKDADGNRSDPAPQVAALWKELDSVMKHSGNKLDGPYVPLKRFGDQVVTVKSRALIDEQDWAKKREMAKDPAHYREEQMDGSYAAENRKAELEAELGDGHVVERSAREVHASMGSGFDALSKLSEAAKNRLSSAEFSDADRAVSHAVHRALTEAIIQSLGEYNARTSGMQRKYIAGGNYKETARAFFTQANYSNQFLAALKHNKEIEQAMTELRTQVKNGGDRTIKQDFYNELQMRRSKEFSQPTPWINNAMKFTSTWKLTTSPAYFLQYLSQPISMFLPVIQSNHGYIKGWAALAGGMKDVLHLSKGLSDVDIDKHQNPQERAMLQEMRRTGTIQIGHEQMYGRLQTLPEKGVSKVWTKAMDKMTMLPHSIEMHNRIASALAAYRLEVAKSGDHEAATAYARKAVQIAYGDYSSFNAPRIMQGGGVVKLMSQYRQFQFIHASMLIRALRNAFADESPEVRKAAKLQLTYMAGHYAVLAGALGIPGAHMVAGAINSVFGDAEDVDIHTFVQRHTSNKVLADLITGGVPKAVFGQDLSYRMGAGDIFSLFKNVGVGDALTSKKGYKDTAIAAMGPFMGGMVPQIIDGVNTIGNGDYYRGLEQLMPKGIADVMKASRYAQDGVVDKKGLQTTKPDELSAGNILGQALGSNQAKITDAQHDASVVGKLQAGFKDQTNLLKSQFVRAKIDGDDVDGIVAKWRTMMEKQRAMGMKPPVLSELYRAPAQMNKRGRMLIDGVPYTKRNKGLVQDVVGNMGEHE
jgi:hypothetical protein